MRHAEAEHNLRNRYNADPLHPRYVPVNLTAHGRKQVVNAAASLRERGVRVEDIDHARVSPLPRTRQTAEILVTEGLLLPSHLIIETRLTEIRMGDREGMLYGAEELQSHHPQAPKYHGESDEQVCARLAHLVEELRAASPRGHVLFVTHGYPALELLDILGRGREQLTMGGFELIPM